MGIRAKDQKTARRPVEQKSEQKSRGIKGDLKMECPFFIKSPLTPTKTPKICDFLGTPLFQRGELREGLFQRGELRRYIPIIQWN